VAFRRDVDGVVACGFAHAVAVRPSTIATLIILSGSFLYLL
jgi:hypothetical protein